MRLLVLFALVASLALPAAAANACDRNPGTPTSGLLMQRTTLAVAYASVKSKPKHHAAKARGYRYYYR